MSEKLSEETIAERFARLGHGKNYAAALAFLRIPARYIDMGQACERHGLARFADDGEMLFQAPDDVIAENAVAAYNAARAEARPAVDREAVITAIGEAVTYLDWYGAELAADAILALLSPTADTAPSRDNAGGGG